MTAAYIKRSSPQRASALAIGLVGLLAIMMLPLGVSASSQSFYVQGSPQSGMLVSLVAQSNTIEPANDDNARSLVGVIAPSDDPSFSQQAGQASVRTDGEAGALVSTLNGSIAVGDRITTSSLQGIGAKLSGNGWIVGTAQASLNSSTKGAVQTTITDSHGTRHAVYAANLPLLVKVSYYDGSATHSGAVPQALQSVADTIAGKHASATALILSFLLAIIAVVLAGMVIESAIRGGLQAVARQPLTKMLIRRNVWQSFGMALIILVAGLAGALLLLRIL